MPEGTTKQAQDGAVSDNLGVLLEQFGVRLDNNGVISDNLGGSNTPTPPLPDPKNA